MFRNLDSDGDWTFGKGLNDYARMDDAISLNVVTRLRSWFGDCFFARLEGIDWNNRIGSFSQEPLLREDIRRIVLQTPDVAELVSLDTSLDRNSRSFRAEVVFRTVNGATYQETVEQSI